MSSTQLVPFCMAGHICITSIKLLPKFDIARWTISMMADKLAATCKFVFVDILTLSFINRLLPNLIYEFSNSPPKFEMNMGFCLLNHNQDGRQNGHHLSVWAWCLSSKNILANQIFLFGFTATRKGLFIPATNTSSHWSTLQRSLPIKENRPIS